MNTPLDNAKLITAMPLELPGILGEARTVAMRCHCDTFVYQSGEHFNFSCYTYNGECGHLIARYDTDGNLW